ncbi:MAG: hypothetical protein ABNH21_06605 [Glaciecola sp.]|jgi:hypothetical protein
MKLRKRLVCNSSTESRFVQVINQVNTSSIRRETADNGDQIIIVPSYTLPDDVVMNGGLYPKQEIENSYQSLEGTPAPIGHPTDTDGNFASARSEIGIDNFHAGVWNKNVQRKDNRIYVEKHINERVAMQTELGKKLMERLNKLIDGDDVEPIHTSVGVFLNSQDKKGEINGNAYDWVASDMEFDHDAILLDEVGAATPESGVGMMVNKDRKMIVNRHIVINDTKQVELSQDEINQIKLGAESLQTLQPNSKSIWQKVITLIANIAGNGEQIGHGGRDSKTNEGEEMKLADLIKMLKANKVEIADDASEAEVTEAFNTHMAANNATDDKQDDNNDIAALVANAVSDAIKPLNEKIDSIESKANAQEEAEKATLIESLKDSDFDEGELKAMSVNTLKKLAQSNAPAYQFNSAFKPSGDAKAPEMPNVEVN